MALHTRVLTAVAVVTASVALAAPDGWHGSLEDGLSAARKSGKPLLVVTAWGNGT